MSITQKKTPNAASLEKAAKQEVVPRRERLRRSLVFRLLLLGVVIAFGALSLIITARAFFQVDVALTTRLQTIHNPLFAGWMQWVSWIGFFPQVVVIAFAFLLILLLAGWKWEATMTALAAIFVMALNLFVKTALHRPRPSEELVQVVATLDSYSFPSGHVMFFLVFFGFLAFLTFTLLKKSVLRRILLAFFLFLIISVGFSRIYLGQHWSSDVVGAYLLGSLALVAVIQVYLWGRARHFLKSAASESSR